MLEDFVTKLLKLFRRGKRIKDIPKLNKLVKADPKLAKLVRDLEQSADDMDDFLKSYRKTNPDIADLADELPDKI